MTIKTDTPTDTYECRAVEILTANETGDVIGYCLGGGRPGPNFLVAGQGPLIMELLEKLIEIPTLPWMWGQLYLLNLEALDEPGQVTPLKSLEEIAFDDTLILPPLDAASDVVSSASESYRAILRACAGMGMIAGRGIKPPPKR